MGRSLGDEIAVAFEVGFFHAVHGQVDLTFEHDAPLAFVGVFTNFYILAELHENDLVGV
jgi:hypothetical protein